MKNHQEKNGKCEDYRITSSSNLNNSEKSEMAVSSENGRYASAKSSQGIDFKRVTEKKKKITAKLQ